MTAQVPDKLLLNGEQVLLFSNPLTAHLATREQGWPFVSRWTANERGYVATWEIRDGALMLVGLRGWLAKRTFSAATPGNVTIGENLAALSELREVGDTQPPCSGFDGPDVPLSLLFPGNPGPIAATWFSGTLRIPKGKRLGGLNMGYEAVYEREVQIVVEQGVVTRTTEVDPAEHPEEWQLLAMATAGHVLEASVETDGTVTCPHCAERFKPTDDMQWNGYRHRCNGWILIVARADEDGWARCPHCNRRFSVSDKTEWNGASHRCGRHLLVR